MKEGDFDGTTSGQRKRCLHTPGHICLQFLPTVVGEAADRCQSARKDLGIEGRADAISFVCSQGLSAAN